MSCAIDVCGGWQGEVLDDQLGRVASAGLRPTARRVLADVRERLIFRAQSHIRDEVVAFQPGEADLDYPGKLERAAAAEEEVAEGSDAAVRCVVGEG
jgi:hypothetical protein